MSIAMEEVLNFTTTDENNNNNNDNHSMMMMTSSTRYSYDEDDDDEEEREEDQDDRLILLNDSNKSVMKKKKIKTTKKQEEEDDDNEELGCLLGPTNTILESNSNPSSSLSLSGRNLWGFYSYSFASEVFAIVAISLFMPITLEQLARENGYKYPNHEESCHKYPSPSRRPQIQHSKIILRGNNISNICQVKLCNTWIDTASFPLYVFSLSVALQAIVVASLGDAADNPRNRKSLLLFFTLIGSLSGILFFFLDSNSSFWYLSSILTILSNLSFGISTVCLNSYIPSLAKNSVKVLKLITEEEDKSLEEKISKATASISSKGIAIGYVSGILVLGLSLLFIIPHEGNTDSLRWAIGLSAVWWMIFTIPAALWLSPSRNWISSSIIDSFDPLKSYRQMLSMLGEHKRLRNTITFLLAWCLLSDAFSTVTSTAIIFGKTSLGMPSSHLILIGMITPSTGLIGAFLAPKIQENLKYCSGHNASLKMFKLLIALSCLVPGYISIPLIFGFQVLTTEVEMYILAAVFGLFYGAFQAYARSVYAELIPPGQEAKWYALYGITDKSSSFFGPFIVGLIADYTHNIRFGFVFILAVLLSSFILLNRVNMLEGKKMAQLFSAIM